MKYDQSKGITKAEYEVLMADAHEPLTWHRETHLTTDTWTGRVRPHWVEGQGEDNR
jgi:hypothetical protein